MREKSPVEGSKTFSKRDWLLSLGFIRFRRDKFFSVVLGWHPEKRFGFVAFRRPGTTILEVFQKGSFEITGSHSRVGTLGGMRTFFFFGWRIKYPMKALREGWDGPKVVPSR